MMDGTQGFGSKTTWRVGVDSGGTFTDVCMFDEASGEIAVWKVSSTPDDPSRGIAQGVEEGMKERAGGSESDPEAAIAYLGHGTTVATNALITHRGAKVGLLTTDGFRDLLEIGRQKRPDLYDLFAEKPKTLVPRELRFELPERMLRTGEVSVPLDEEAVRKAARAMKAAGVEAVAICFLYAFVNPAHEKIAKAIVEDEMPGVFLCASHEIAPEFRNIFFNLGLALALQGDYAAAIEALSSYRHLAPGEEGEAAEDLLAVLRKTRQAAGPPDSE